MLCGVGRDPVHTRMPTIPLSLGSGLGLGCPRSGQTCGRDCWGWCLSLAIALWAAQPSCSLGQEASVFSSDRVSPFMCEKHSGQNQLQEPQEKPSARPEPRSPSRLAEEGLWCPAVPGAARL